MHPLFRRALVSLLVSLCLPSFAQVATGTYPYGSFDNLGFDTVNRGNLNVHFSIPVVNKPGRGLSFYYNLAYDSSVWYPETVDGSLVWTPMPNFGWHVETDVATGYISYNFSLNIITCFNGSQEGNTVITDVVYHDQFGGAHPFSGSYSADDCPDSPINDTISTTAGDNSGYQLATSNGRTNYDGPVIDRSGSSFVVPINLTTGEGSATDLNGNEITIDSNGNFTDTTGQVALAISTADPSPSVPEVLDYKDTNGNSQPVRITYASYTVQTNFGCSGIGEYSNTASLPDTITFPDGSVMQFAYEPTPGNPSSVTGRIASVTLRQGGEITYTYTGGNNGIVCTDGSAAGLTRSLPDDSANPTRTYMRTIASPSTSSTDVTDGAGNNSEYSFVLPGNQIGGVTAAYYESGRSIYQGSASGTPLSSTQTCYNGAPEGCATTAPQLPITQIDTYSAHNGGLQDGSTFLYDQYGYGLVTEEEDWDFGSASARGTSLLREENLSYEMTGTAAFLQQDNVIDGAGNGVSSAAYTYDSASLTPSSGVPQHIAESGPRGNLTEITEETASNQHLTVNNTYEDTGSLLTSTGPNGETTVSYDPTFSYLTNVTPPTPSSGVSLPDSATDDINTGLPLTFTDPNNETITYKTYDEMLRPTEIDHPDGGTEAFSYPSPNQVGDLRTMNSSTEMSKQTLLDGYGRLSRIAVYNGQATNPWYQTDYCYGADGRLAFQSYPYQGQGFVQGMVCSGAGDTYSRDALGRVTQVIHGDGTSVGYQYSGRAMQATDENGVSRIAQVDALGRIASVCEISSNGSMPGSGSPVNCGLDIAGTGFLTAYSYNLANHTTTITQGSQARVFQTDWIGRPVLIQEPESGTTTYSYAYNGTGLVVTRQRPQANQSNPNALTTTTTQYDAVGRPVSVSYSDGTPTKSFAYDQANMFGGSVSAGASKGELTSVSVNVGSSAAATAYGYDAVGNITATDECLPSGCGNAAEDKWSYYSYDWLGNLTSLQDSSGATTSYTYSPASEVQSITSSLNDATHPPNLVSNVQNGPFGPTSYQLGNGLSEALTYDQLGRLNGQWVCSGSGQPYCSGGTQLYGFVVTYQGQRNLGICDTVIGKCEGFGYDEFNRLTLLSVNTGTIQNYTYSYDRYGNRWQQNALQGGWTSNLSFNTANNEINTSGYAYDAAGDLTNDGNHSYNYDAEGNLTQVDGGNTATYQYDALNERVTIDEGGNFEGFVYNQNSQRASIWNLNSWAEMRGETYWSGMAVEFNYNNQANFQLQDWTGTDRMFTDYAGNVGSTVASLPFGDGSGVTGSGFNPWVFAGLDKDYYNGADSGTDHAQFRQYSDGQGNWMSPDPYSGSYDFTNPQSLNRYSYALNNPLTFTDPSGLDYGFDCGPNCVGVVGTPDDGFEFGAGGIPSCGSAGDFQPVGDVQVCGGGHAPRVNPFAPNKPTCTTGFGLGLTAGGDATAGLGYGAGANGSVGAGVFGGSNGLDAGAFASGGAGENFGSGASIPGANLIGRFFGGLVAGGGVGGFITNASQADQLQGLSGTWTVDFGSLINGAGQFSAGTDAAGNSIWSFSFTLGLGYGAGVQTLTNKTATTGFRGGC